MLESNIHNDILVISVCMSG